MSYDPRHFRYDTTRFALNPGQQCEDCRYFDENDLLDSPGSSTAPPLNGTGAVIFQVNHLRGPLALVLVPNGDLITSNGDAVNPM